MRYARAGQGRPGSSLVADQRADNEAHFRVDDGESSAS